MNSQGYWASSTSHSLRSKSCDLTPRGLYAFRLLGRIRVVLPLGGDTVGRGVARHSMSLVVTRADPQTADMSENLPRR